MNPTTLPLGQPPADSAMPQPPALERALAEPFAFALLQWPLLLAVLHNGGAAALVGVLVTLNYRVQRASVQTVTAAAIAPAAARASG